MAKLNSNKIGGKLSLRGRPKDPAKREAVLAEAFDLFVEVGFDGASMDTLARRANLSKATLYSHFGSKNKIFQALIDEKIAEYYQVSSEILDIHPRAHLMRLAEQFFDLIHDDKALALTRLIVGSATHFPKIVKVFYEIGPARIQADFMRAIAALPEVEETRAADVTQLYKSLLVPHYYFLGLLVAQVEPMSKAERKIHIQKQTDLFFSLL
jgi:TetR/AcrR family transcriptional repressor of mexJK operon